METKKKREVYIDSAGGLLLIYMIVYHCAQHAGYGEAFISHTLLLSFFMQWFFFKAGMFYRPVTFKDNMRKSFKRLIVPWIVFNIVGTAVYLLQQYLAGECIDGHYLMRYCLSIGVYGSSQGNLALWFLTSLFAVRVIYALIAPLRHSWVYVVLFALVPIVMRYGVANMVSYKTWMNIPYYISNVSMGLVFYALGDYLRRYQPSATMLCLLAGAFVAVTIVDPTYVYMYENKLMMGTYLLAPVYALLGIIVINALARRIADRKNLLSMIGADTMPYYCMHWIVIVGVTIFFDTSVVPNAPMLVCMIAANIVLLPILTYAIKRTRLRFIFG